MTDNKFQVYTHIFDVKVFPDEMKWSKLSNKIKKIGLEGELIRLVLVKAEKNYLTFEANLVKTKRLPSWPSLFSSVSTFSDDVSQKSVVINIIPTGVRSEIGGFAGDGTPCTNILAKTCDYLITNPNSVTASDLYYGADNIQYVEGNLICRFMTGQIDLISNRHQKVGLLIEQPQQEATKNNVINAINAMRTVAGITVDPVILTKNPIEAHCAYSSFGQATGRYGSLDELITGIDALVADGTNAVGIVSSLRLEQSIREQYYAGKEIPNPWGSAEAIITHLATTYNRVTAAHSPLLMEKDHTMFGSLVDPRDGAELISSAYLCSMVRGLSRSPRVITSDSKGNKDGNRLSISNVRAVVMPETTVGNIPFFAALDHDIPIILVKENKTISNITPDCLGINNENYNIHVVKSYMEAAGLLIALNHGINIDSLKRPIKPLEIKFVT